MGHEVLYCPAGVKRRLPSGVNVRRRKNEVRVSLWYMLAFRTERPIAALRLGEEISGLTAGKGNEGAGDADLRKDGDEPKDDRLLESAGGGSMGIGIVNGVPGFEGAGEAIAAPLVLEFDARCPGKSGAGLFEEIRRPGRSILLNLPCVDSVQVPSLSLRA